MTEKRIPSPCDSSNPLHKIAAELAQSSPSDKKHEAKTAKQQFDEHTAGEDMTPLERLRFFCSLAFKEGQDWLDVEPFFDDIEKQLAQSATRRDIHAEAMYDLARWCGWNSFSSTSPVSWIIKKMTPENRALYVGGER